MDIRYKKQQLIRSLCFPYSIVVALHHEEITYNPGRISKLKPFISNYNWKDISFLSGQKDWKTFGRNN